MGRTFYTVWYKGHKKKIRKKYWQYWTWYKEVPPGEVRTRTMKAALEALDKAERDLGLPPLTLRWFRVRKGTWPFGRLSRRSLEEKDPAYARLQRRNNPNQGGLVCGDVCDTLIWIRVTSLPDKAVAIVAHEARHLWQQRHWKYTGDFSKYRKEREKDAEEYAERFCWKW